MDVEVKFGSTTRLCTVVSRTVCRRCGEEIIWALTPNEKYIPLNSEKDEWGVMVPHFSACAPRSRSAPEPEPEPEPVAGIQMSEQVWRGLLMLVHPDRHHGTANEKLATSLTTWLLEQKPKLSDRRN